MLAASARIPTPILSNPIAAMNCHASRTFFWAFFRSAGSAGLAAPDTAAQFAADDDSSCGAAASFGGVHVCCAGATAPTAAHMSQLLRPRGVAQPHGLQTAMNQYRTPPADPPRRAAH